MEIQHFEWEHSLKPKFLTGKLIIFPWKTQHVYIMGKLTQLRKSQRFEWENSHKYGKSPLPMGKPLKTTSFNAKNSLKMMGFAERYG